MSKRIFSGIFFVALAVLIIGISFTAGILHDYYSSQFAVGLMNEAHAIGSAVEQIGKEYLSDDISDKYQNRITLIGADGKVIFDSSADPAEMENHSDRKEFAEALSDGEGTDERTSATLAEKTVYAAVKLRNGSVLRIASTRLSVLSIILAMAQPLCFLLVIVLILSGVFASMISKKIVKPINDIDLEKPSKTGIYQELYPLVDKIESQKIELDERMRELQREHDSQDKLRREFTANVSHELKTPLTSISGFAEIIRDGIVKEQDVKRFAGNIYDETGRLITLVGDIIKLSELDEGADNAQREPIDLYEISESVIGHLQSTAAKSDVSITLSGESAVINGSRQILDEMIYNLCDNAIKYNKPGGFVKVNISKKGFLATLSVEDNGIGIPEEDKERVFERFYRVNKSHSKEIGGTGLGLSIVKHSAAFHNAKIELDSLLGKGTTIKIIFPTADSK